ncbi:hypothetical protein B0O99DRAFT_651980 [Bisporella sp. PMI_857]|nr:hypothetical protein B0O99DRAFT_651980 [Bisporella sp. PMI_857]
MSSSDSSESIDEAVTAMLFRLHALVIGLGLERDELMQGTCTHDYKNCILTPNVVGFGRLCKAKALRLQSWKVTVAQRGGNDYMPNGEYTYISDLDGGLKRSGGQGDTLAGNLATFLWWRKACIDRILDHEGDMNPTELIALVGFGGGLLTRECSRFAFAKKGRSLQASDLTEEVAVAFTRLFEADTEDKRSS